MPFVDTVPPQRSLLFDGGKGERQKGFCRFVEETALYSRLRSITCAALIVFATVIAIGAPVALRLALDQPRISANEPSESWPLPGRDLPWITRHASNTGAIESLPAAETLATEPLRKADLFARSGEPEPLAMAAPAEEERTALAPPEPAVPLTTPPIESPPRVKPVERKIPPRTANSSPSRSQLNTARQAPQRTRTAKASTREALGVMRRFDERSSIPVDAYSADGAPRRIIIRPTSIQDVYYYSNRRW
jgi:hypothetical protein